MMKLPISYTIVMAACAMTGLTPWLKTNGAEPTNNEWLLRELVPQEKPLEWENQLAVHGLFTDGMVLQRDMPVPVWGWGPNGAEVEVRFGNACVKAKVSGHCWAVNLPPMPADSHCRELSVICGARCVVFKDVLVGDVWLCSGQSNMQVEMKLDAKAYPRRAADIKAANNPLIRFFKVDRATSRQPLRNVPPVRNDLYAPWGDAYLGNQWRPCTKEWVPHVSATAFYFAREMQPDLHIPIGMLICARGATGIGDWVSAEVIEKDPCWGTGLRSELTKAETHWAQLVDSQALAWRAYREKYPLPKAVWEARVAHKTVLPSPRQIQWPTCCFNAMLHPMVPFAVKGVLWYQGENDVNNAAPYAAKMVSLIRSWRELWQREDMPFIITQLAGFEGKDPANSASACRAELRTAQARVPGMIAKTYMATVFDAGMRNNIHPYFKEVAGHRLALVARKEIYGEQIAAYGPALHSVIQKDSTLVLSFDHAEKGLIAKEVNLDGERLPATVLEGFTLCGADRKFAKANATISGNQVIVANPSIHDPVAVRYAWANFPLANLYNGDDLPAAPFQAEVTTKPR